MKKTEQGIGWLLFIFVFIIYAFCTPRTITFWDSAEFIASNYKLQITHPPGAPFYMLFCKFILSFFPVSMVAYINNLVSSLFGSLTIVLLYFITIEVAKSVLNNKHTKQTQNWLPIICGIIASSTLAFIHSFWVASTESEVYTLSFSLLLAVLYTMIQWKKTNNQKKEIRLLFLITFLIGISVGVHLINISIVIPLSILYTYKKFGLTLKNLCISLVGGALLFFTLYGVLIQGFLTIANKLDVSLVNDFNFSVNSGPILLTCILTICFGIALLYTYKQKKIAIHHSLLALLFFCIGMSSYTVSMIRANTHTPTSNEPSTSNQLLQYIRAEQFGLGEVPLLRGHLYNAPLDKTTPFTDGPVITKYNREKKKYITIDHGHYSKPNYAREFSSLFPRMYHKGTSNINGYNSWTPIKGKTIPYPVQGKIQQIKTPTFLDNFNFFITYQISWLNLRYLFWNFIGRQNDTKGTGEILNGNWKSGINILDSHRIGDKKHIPDQYHNDLSNDYYYFIPFIFGLIGLFTLRKNYTYLATTVVFFLTFGIGITIYVNPTPSSILIRERDYIFMGSFIIFALWIGLSTLSLFNLLRFIVVEKTRLITVGLSIGILVPVHLLAKGWDDHNRSRDHFAYDFAKSYLDSCPTNSILITNGDNMTFPLWYLQEVEDYRTDIRIVNFDQLTLDWYIEKLKRKVNSSNPISISLPQDIYTNNQQLLPLKKEVNQAVDVKLLFDFLSDAKTRVSWNGKKIHYIPSEVFSIPIDTVNIPHHLYSRKELQLDYTDKITWKFPKEFYAVNDLVLLNIVQQNILNRPICFAINGNKNHYIGLQKHTIQRGLVDLLAPVKRSKPSLNPKIVDTKTMYPIFIKSNIFKNLNDPSIFIDDESRTYAQKILRKNYYFLAQALLEEGKTDQAIKVLDTCISILPDTTIPFRQYAYALGKLYYRAGDHKKGKKICLSAMLNIWQELQWITSFDPLHPIINVKHATRLKKMYSQMINQLKTNHPKESNRLSIQFQKFEVTFQNWHTRNWPY
ncbi:DUF2723 domain-containing protein [Aquimarina aquimarini]|uniref:glycosyltransferase family 117 protein n=1 Tax=Aquimarina aquimarini TaxID=1191734 RepID=UPI000D54F82B|nr:DUF2723 domain-containing protein [Aquimarina aquimarini]